jgi:hypothetical protein
MDNKKCENCAQYQRCKENQWVKNLESNAIKNFRKTLKTDKEKQDFENFLKYAREKTRKYIERREPQYLAKLLK